MLLAMLPPLLALGAVVAARQSALASERRRRVLAGVTAAWMGAAAVVLWLVRRKIRGWETFDNRTFDYVFVGSLAGLVVLAFGIGLLGVLGRSSRGVPLCPRCWYDMSGHEGLCPECGTRIRDGRELVRRRRSATVVSMAVALQLLAQFLYQYHRADHGGGQGLVPTSVLIAGAFALPREVIVSAPGARDHSLTGRMADNKLSDWQQTWLASRARAALEAGASSESVGRAVALLIRGEFETELTLEAWKRAVRVLLADGLSGPGAAPLLRSYLESRSDDAASTYVRTPRDPSRAAKELEEFVPAFEGALRGATPGNEEWGAAIRMLAAAGRADRAVELAVEAGSFERSPQGVVETVYVLSQLGRSSPAASEALLGWLQDIVPGERFFSMVWVCRVGPESLWAQEAFRALAACGEANLEVLGAAGLAGSPSTRCEGTDLLIARMAQWKPVAPVFLMTLQWPILVSPDDRHAGELLVEIQRYALEGTPEVRSEAIGVLGQIGQQVPSRRAEIIAFLRALQGVPERGLAETARNTADDLIGRRDAQEFIRVRDE